MVALRASKNGIDNIMFVSKCIFLHRGQNLIVLFTLCAVQLY